MAYLAPRTKDLPESLQSQNVEAWQSMLELCVPSSPTPQSPALGLASIIVIAVVTFATPLTLIFIPRSLPLTLVLIRLSTFVLVPRWYTIIPTPIGLRAVSFVSPSFYFIQSDKNLANVAAHVLDLLLQLHVMYWLGGWVGAHGGAIWEDHELFTNGIFATEEYWFVYLAEAVRITEALGLL